jgi:hypothetical protein
LFYSNSSTMSATDDRQAVFYALAQIATLAEKALASQRASAVLVADAASSFRVLETAISAIKEIILAVISDDSNVAVGRHIATAGFVAEMTTGAASTSDDGVGIAGGVAEMSMPPFAAEANEAIEHQHRLIAEKSIADIAKVMDTAATSIKDIVRGAIKSSGGRRQQQQQQQAAAMTPSVSDSTSLSLSSSSTSNVLPSMETTGSRQSHGCSIGVDSGAPAEARPSQCDLLSRNNSTSAAAARGGEASGDDEEKNATITKRPAETLERGSAKKAANETNGMQELEAFYQAAREEEEEERKRAGDNYRAMSDNSTQGTTALMGHLVNRLSCIPTTALEVVEEMADPAARDDVRFAINTAVGAWNNVVESIANVTADNNATIRAVAATTQDVAADHNATSRELVTGATNIINAIFKLVVLSTPRLDDAPAHFVGEDPYGRSSTRVGSGDFYNDACRSGDGGAAFSTSSGWPCSPCRSN